MTIFYTNEKSWFVGFFQEWKNAQIIFSRKNLIVERKFFKTRM